MGDILRAEPALPGKGPRHLAIIMDGNGRWAERRGLPRFQGHKAGVVPIRMVVEQAPQYGVQFLTLYAFSTENWRRPRPEVEGLFGLLQEYVQIETDTLVAQGVRVRFLGERAGLPRSVVSSMAWCEQETAGGSRLVLNIAVNYGSRQEIVLAARHLAGQVEQGLLKAGDIGPEDFERGLYTAGLPDPDLLIRTAGEQRLSNFLLWQLAYAEIYITSTLWPDFAVQDLETAVDAYRSRERRFGGLTKKG